MRNEIFVSSSCSEGLLHILCVAVAELQHPYLDRLDRGVPTVTAVRAGMTREREGGILCIVHDNRTFGPHEQAAVARERKSYLELLYTTLTQAGGRKVRIEDTFGNLLPHVPFNLKE